MVTKEQLQSILTTIYDKQRAFKKDSPDWILLEGSIIILNSLITNI